MPPGGALGSREGNWTWRPLVLDVTYMDQLRAVEPVMPRAIDLLLQPDHNLRVAFADGKDSVTTAPHGQ